MVGCVWRIWLPVFGALVLLLGAACGGDDPPKSAAGPVGERRSLTDCDYAKALEETTVAFFGGLTRATLPSQTASAGDARAAFAAFNSEMDRQIGELRRLSLSAEMQGLNDGFIALFQGLVKQTERVRDAAAAGDGTRVSGLIAALGDDLVARAEKVQREHPAAAAKFEACRTG